MSKKNEQTLEYMTKPLERFSYWSYFVGQNIFYTLVVNFLATYLALVGIELVKIAGVMFIVKVWDAINDTLFGFIFDKVKFKNKQKSLPWLRISLALIPIATIILFAIPGDLSENMKLLLFAFAYLLWDTSYTLSDVPIFSMVTTMTSNLNERNTLMSSGRLFSMISASLTGIIGTFLISESVGFSFRTMVIILSLLAVVFMLPICIVGKERNYNPEDAEQKITFRQMLTYLKGNKYLIIYFVAYLFTSGLLTTNVVQLFASYYLFGSVNFSNIIFIITAIPALAATLLLPMILRKVDKFKLLTWMNIVGVVLGLVIYLLGWSNRNVFLILTTIRVIPLSLLGVLGFMFTADCAEYGYYKTGVDAKGMAFAIQTFTAKLTAAISSALGLVTLSLFNWTQIQAQSFADLEKLNVVQSPQALNGLWITYILVPTIGMAISAVVYIFYKLNDKDVQLMAKCNSKEISREEAERQMSRKY